MERRDLLPEEKLLCCIFGERPNPVRHFLSEEGIQVVHNVLGELEAGWGWIKSGKRYVKVLRLRFGFIPLNNEERLYSGGKATSRTLEQTAVYFDVTRERVRQIEAKIVRRLRKPDYSRKLVSYIWKSDKW